MTQNECGIMMTDIQGGVTIEKAEEESTHEQHIGRNYSLTMSLRCIAHLSSSLPKMPWPLRR